MTLLQWFFYLSAYCHIVKLGGYFLVELSFMPLLGFLTDCFCDGEQASLDVLYMLGNLGGVVPKLDVRC
jgi:hypothetical protein